MTHLTGDILRITTGTILHQVNCRGVIGGLAGALRARYPIAFSDYFILCDKYGFKNLGSVHEGHVSARLSIIHVFGQMDPGANTDMTAVRHALELLKGRPLLRPIYAPFKLGCGLGGGNWPIYQAALADALPDVTIIQLPEDRPS